MLAVSDHTTPRLCKIMMLADEKGYFNVSSLELGSTTSGVECRRLKRAALVTAAKDGPPGHRTTVELDNARVC